MSEVSQSVQCGACGVSIDESPNASHEGRKPCPSCGSIIRHFNVNIEETLPKMHESLGTKQKDASGKTLLETVDGDDLYKKTGKWNHLKRIIDHANDLYEKVVTDPETGEVVHFQKEPLSQHRGHGDDRKNQTAPKKTEINSD